MIAEFKKEQQYKIKKSIFMNKKRKNSFKSNHRI